MGSTPTTDLQFSFQQLEFISPDTIFQRAFINQAGANHNIQLILLALDTKRCIKGGTVATVTVPDGDVNNMTVHYLVGMDLYQGYKLTRDTIKNFIDYIAERNISVN